MQYHGEDLKHLKKWAYKLLLEKGFKVIDRDLAKTPEERTEIMRQALLCDTF